MSKYYDRLISINESLRKEMKEQGLALEGDDETIEVPADSVTPEQKQNILSDMMDDAKVDKKTADVLMDGLKDNPEAMDGAAKVLSNVLKKESADEEYIIRMDDDDLDMHGYLELANVQDGFSLTEEEGGAAIFNSEEAARDEIETICRLYHYDPETFSLQNLNSMVDDNGENWVSIDTMHPGASTIG